MDQEFYLIKDGGLVRIDVPHVQAGPDDIFTRLIAYIRAAQLDHGLPGHTRERYQVDDPSGTIYLIRSQYPEYHAFFAPSAPPDYACVVRGLLAKAVAEYPGIALPRI